MALNNGSKLRIYNLLAGLAERHQVTLVTFRDADEAEAPPAQLLELCDGVRTIPRKNFDPWSAQSLAGLVAFKPRSAIDTRSVEMERQIKSALESSDYDCVVASQLRHGSVCRLLCGLARSLRRARAGSVLRSVCGRQGLQLKAEEWTDVGETQTVRRELARLVRSGDRGVGCPSGI